MKSWSLKFATQTLFRRSGSELFDTFTNIILLRIFHYKILIHEKRQIPGEPLAARYNWCQGPVPGRGPAVEKHWRKIPVILVRFQWSLNFLGGFSTNPRISNFVKIRTVGVELFSMRTDGWTNGQTGRQTDMTKKEVAFRKIAKSA